MFTNFALAVGLYSDIQKCSLAHFFSKKMCHVDFFSYFCENLRKWLLTFDYRLKALRQKHAC